MFSALGDTPPETTFEVQISQASSNFGVKTIESRFGTFTPQIFTPLLSYFDTS
jgi:hypothetical protein